jgi:hypothetical protein
MWTTLKKIEMLKKNICNKSTSKTLFHSHNHSGLFMSSWGVLETVKKNGGSQLSFGFMFCIKIIFPF